MDSLGQDFTNALDESAGTQNVTMARREYKKRKCKKRKQLGGQQKSNSSGSSRDEGPKDINIEGLTQQSDSDEIPPRLPSLHLANHLTSHSLPESDSVTENFSPMRPHRRRRKFKRMAVDPQPHAELPIPPSPRHRHNRGKLKTLDTKDDNIMDVENHSDTAPGKRKRGVKEKSFDADTCDPNAPAGASSSKSMDCGNDMGSQESNNSSLSSSESEIGFFTTDEDRDGDDEQSDFYHENGPACGITGIIPWWEDETGTSMDPKDLTFEQILTGSFANMSSDAKKSYKARLKTMGKSNREIKSGRRRLKDRNPGYSMSCFLKERQQWSGDSPKMAYTLWQNHASGLSGDIKRRRKTPPLCPNPEGFVGENAGPIPESNLGNRMLQNMGWSPGSGLGATKEGITDPVMAYLRPKRLGLGANK